MGTPTPGGEPLLTAGLIGSLTSALVTGAVAFGLNLSEQQQAAVTGFVAVAAPLIVASAARRKVTPNSRVSEWVRDGQVITGPANDRKPQGFVVRDIGSPVPRRAADDDGDGAPDTV